MDIKRLVLFIYETALLSSIDYLYTDKEYQIVFPFNERILDPTVIDLLNLFIIDRYEENKELLKVIFDLPDLEEFINNKYDILELEPLIKIFKEYRGTEKYLKLVEEAGPEIDSKLNNLALNFIKYYNDILKLSSLKPNIYQKVLQ